MAWAAAATGRGTCTHTLAHVSRVDPACENHAAPEIASPPLHGMSSTDGQVVRHPDMES